MAVGHTWKPGHSALQECVPATLLQDCYCFQLRGKAKQLAEVTQPQQWGPGPRLVCAVLTLPLAKRLPEPMWHRGMCWWHQTLASVTVHRENHLNTVGKGRMGLYGQWQLRMTSTAPTSK